MATLPNMGLIEADLDTTADITVFDDNLILIDNHDHTAGKGLAVGRLASGVAVASPALSGTITGTPTVSGIWTFSATITSALGTITASTPAFTSTATWNNAAVTFTHFFANITDTASAAASKLIELQVGGSPKFILTKAGNFGLGVTPVGAPTNRVQFQFGQSGFLMADTAADNVYFGQNTYYDVTTNKAIITAAAARAYLSAGAFKVQLAPSVSAGSAQTFTDYLTLTAGGLLQLSSGGTPAAPAVSWNGDPNTGLYGYAADILGFTAGGVLAGYWSNGYLVPNVNVVPFTDNAYVCGQSGNRWSAVWAVNGTIQTSHFSTKNILGDTDPVAAYDALRATTLQRFAYKTEPDVEQYGVILRDEPTFYSHNGRDIHPLDVAWKIGAAVQHAQDRIARLEAALVSAGIKYEGDLGA